MILKKYKEYFQLILLLFGDFFRKRDHVVNSRKRKKVATNDVFVEVHEWGGYDLHRVKHVRSIKPYECGLEGQIKRFTNYEGDRKVRLTITMSESEKHKDLQHVKDSCEKFMATANTGKDFGGYRCFFDMIKSTPNSYVILTNSSVNEHQTEFLDGYINYMEENQDVAILGVSYNSKCYQSLVRNNFTPHLQSFFLMTTIDVLNEIVNENKGKFPGAEIDNKQLLIREGEIKISQLALKLGYKLAVVLESGVHKFSNLRTEWSLPDGDCRQRSEHPSMIYKIE